MKVVQFIYGLGIGGAEALVKNYVSNFDNKKIDILLLCLHHYEDSPYEKDLTDKNNVRMIFIDDYLCFRNCKNVFGKVIRRIQGYCMVRRIIRKESPDILHTHLPLYTYVRFARPSRKTILFDTIHTEPKRVWLAKDDRKRLFEYLAARWLVKKRKMIFIVLHEKMKKDINQMFGTTNSIVLNNGIDVSKYVGIKNKRELMRRNLGISDDAFVIGHIGRFTQSKNHDFLIEIFAAFKKIKRDSFLLLIGDGEERKRIIEKMEKYDFHENDYVILSKRDDIPNLLAVMDVFVFPSLFEGLPLSLVEAQEAKLPCFISDKVSERATISNLVTRLSLNDVPEKWARAIVNYKKPKKVIVNDEDWDIKKITKQLEEIYERELSERNNGKK